MSKKSADPGADGSRLITSEKEFKQFTAPGAKCPDCEEPFAMNHRVLPHDGSIVPCGGK